jgi:4-amino-4-deoxy-L-arabinose transferase-like glycosyltransferase
MKQVNRTALFIGIILLIALVVRLWGINYDLPYIYHPDEPVSINIIQNIIKTGDLNPHFFDYPSLFFYINALAYIPYYIIGKLLGIFAWRGDILAPISFVMGVTKTQLPSSVMLGRIITVIFGVGTVGITYLIGRRLTGKVSVGLLAASLMTINFTNVSLSRFITPDTFVTFFAAAAFLGSVLIYQEGKTRWYIIAGLCVGLAASTKYNGGLIVIPLILAHFLRHGKRALVNRNLYIALSMSVLGFLLGTPYALLDFPTFWSKLRLDSLHYATGHAGMEGDTLRWYLNYAWRTGGVIYILSILGIIQGIYTRSKEIILLSIFPVVYIVFINLYFVRNDRTFLLITPFLFLLTAIFLEFLIRKTSLVASKTWLGGSRVILGCVFLVTFVYPALITVNRTIGLTSVNSRETSRVWIDENLPTGAKIAVEAYSPFVDPSRFSVEGFISMIDHDPAWYAGNGFDYLVFSEGMYGRFFAEPDRYSSEVSQYNYFFSDLEWVKSFNDGNTEIRLYKVSSPEN